MTGFRFDTLRKALESKDVESLLSLYDRNAAVRVINKNTPPSRPFETSGWPELEAYIRDVCDRDLSHQVGDEVIGQDRVSYTETCSYPDGTKVFTANYLEIEDGSISRHTVLETWDE